MTFLDALNPEERKRFETAATRIEVEKGDYLLKRGEPGGDIFFIESGTFEVIDTRSTSEVILAVIEEGSVVGEMSFIDNSPRSADVRASTPCLALRWHREDMKRVLTRLPHVAIGFYESLAQLAATRARQANTTVAMGGMIQPSGLLSNASQRAAEEARRLSEIVKSSFIEAETSLRRDPNDKERREHVFAILDNLEQEVHRLCSTHPGKADSEEMGNVLRRELHPYLVRSSLAERCTRTGDGVSRAPDILAHILVNHPGGDGVLGELIDQWMLARPMFKAMRYFRQAIPGWVAPRLPTHRNRRVLVLNAGTGSLIANLAAKFTSAPTVVSVMDHSRDALDFLDEGLAVWPPTVELQKIQENLARFAMGRFYGQLPLQDIVLIYGILEYMPERIAISLIEVIKKVLSPGGHIVLCNIGPGDDAAFLDRLLGWPIIRRTESSIKRIFQAAELECETMHDPDSPAQLICATLAHSIHSSPTVQSSIEN